MDSVVLGHHLRLYISNKVLGDRVLLAQGSHLEQHNSAAGCGILDKSAPTSPFSLRAAGRAEERCYLSMFFLGGKSKKQ